MKVTNKNRVKQGVYNVSNIISNIFLNSNILFKGGITMKYEAKIDMENAIGEVKKGMECKIIQAWFNHTTNEIYCEVKFIENNLLLITSINNIESIQD